MQGNLVAVGLSERTLEMYLRAVRQLSQHYSRTFPSELSEEQVKDYLLWLRTEKRAARETSKIAIGESDNRTTQKKHSTAPVKSRVRTSRHIPEPITHVAQKKTQTRGPGFLSKRLELGYESF